MRNKPALGLCAAAVLLFSAIGCGTGLELSIATDLPEVVEYLEFMRGNISPSNFQVIFDAEPDRSVVLGDISPDIIISRHITHENFSDELYRIPLSRLNKQGGGKADHFVLEDIYPESFAPYRRNNAVFAFTLAFDLPIVYSRTDLLQEWESSGALTYDRLLETAAEYTTVRRNIYSTMGFSSLRNILFIDLLIRENTDVRGTIPPQETLPDAIAQINEYLVNNTQEPPAQVYFNEIFAYSPDFSDMREGHLFSSLSSLYTHNSSLPANAFPYHWLYSGAATSMPEQIEAIDPVYIGILQAAGNKSQAINILRQVLSARIQTDYLQKLSDSRKPFRFFLSRLSSNRMVNEHTISRFTESIPEHIIFPGQTLFLWDEIKTQVYYPWITANLTEPEISTEDLYRNLESYYKLNGRYQ